MSRRKSPPKRVVLPDPKFHNVDLTKFINTVMRDGKKSVAEKIVYGALSQVEAKGHVEPVDTLFEALENVAPKVEVKFRRVGGSNYQVPVEVRPERRLALGMRWMVEAARNRGEKSMGQRLAGEILDALENRGSAVKRREDTHRMAEANKAFAHFRW
jgi:small subunit ribosomal protein S7